MALYVKDREEFNWPQGRQFALSIMDDTDYATLENVRPFYDSLERHRIYTTKTVWAIPGERNDGETLSDEDYRAWIVALAKRGFEISWHGARPRSTEREKNERALQMFHDCLGTWPKTYANHSQNMESLYWGEERLDSPVLRAIYRGLRLAPKFLGDDAGSGYFWGDLCREHIRYVRNFTFDDVVTTDADPYMPYYDAARPYVRAWFSASDGIDVAQFLHSLRTESLDRLERSGGACIIYTHAASGFVRDRNLNPHVEALFDELERRGGWYVPVATLLEHLEEVRGLRVITPRMRSALETRWASGRVSALLRGAFHNLQRLALPNV